jgi:hypothetical protein
MSARRCCPPVFRPSTTWERQVAEHSIARKSKVFERSRTGIARGDDFGARLTAPLCPASSDAGLSSQLCRAFIAIAANSAQALAHPAGALSEWQGPGLFFCEEEIAGPVEFRDDFVKLLRGLLRYPIRHSSPASVWSVRVSTASGLEFSDATTTAPVHATMPGNFKTDMSERSSKQ